MNIIAKTIAIVLTTAALSPLSAMAHHNGEYVKDPLGTAVAPTAATRTIDVNDQTRSISVEQGEIVRFNIDGKVFAWQFDTLRDGRMDLSTIAPADVHVHGVSVYVAPNPIYRN